MRATPNILGSYFHISTHKLNLPLSLSLSLNVSIVFSIFLSKIDSD